MRAKEIRSMAETGEIVEVKLPDLGEGVESADVLAVLVRVGDRVAAEADLLELEVSKAAVIVPSPAPGQVQAVHVEPGETVRPGQLLVSLLAG
jgi:pyruvate/2-oxoglutarate dehydrogenase complex dihydrolipoamide acyltransferase (E2) component